MSTFLSFLPWFTNFVLVFVLSMTLIANIGYVKTMNALTVVNLDTIRMLSNSEKLNKLLLERNRILENKVSDNEITVTVTMYQPVSWQTDSTPNITADGTVLRNLEEAHKYKFIAISRNLLARYGGFLKFGDFVRIAGTKNKDGVYQVKDLMHQRWVNRVDILESLSSRPYRFNKATLKKLVFN